jgi:LysR family glycine cleavage system transcriptional activator
MPRLHRFVTEYPEIDIRLIASMRVVDSLRHGRVDSPMDSEATSQDADIGIHFGRGNYPRCRVDALFNASVTPLCSPQLLNGMRPLRKPEDLHHHLLLHDDTPFGGDDRPDWVQWLKMVGVDDIDTSRGLHFNHAMLGLEAAIDGLGVVLGIKELAARDIAAGRLVAPFEYSMALPNSYFLVSPESVALRPKVVAFRNWLLEEVRLRLNSKTLAG